MNKRIGELTVKDLDSMSRAQLLDYFQQMAAFFPVNLVRSVLESLPEADLRRFANRARRKLHGMGY